MRRTVVALVAVLALLGLGAAKCDTSAPVGGPQHAAGKHRQQPAPIPDTPPAARRSFPASIQIVLAWTQQQSRTVVLFDFGQGKQHRTGKGPDRWTVRVQPNQYVYGLVTPAYPGEYGHLTLVIYQLSSGTVICKDDNADAGSKGSVDCGGHVKV